MPGWQHAACIVRSTSPTPTPFDLSTPSHSCRVSVIAISPLQLLSVPVQGAHRSALSLCHCALAYRGLCSSPRRALPLRSEDRRVGIYGYSTCRTWCLPYPYKKNTTI